MRNLSVGSMIHCVIAHLQVLYSVYSGWRMDVLSLLEAVVTCFLFDLNGRGDAETLRWAVEFRRATALKGCFTLQYDPFTAGTHRNNGTERGLFGNGHCRDWWCFCGPCHWSSCGVKMTRPLKTYISSLKKHSWNLKKEQEYLLKGDLSLITKEGCGDEE